MALPAAAGALSACKMDLIWQHHCLPDFWALALKLLACSP